MTPGNPQALITHAKGLECLSCVATNPHKNMAEKSPSADKLTVSTPNSDVISFTSALSALKSGTIKSAADTP
jgi:hypothetical protein